MQIVQESLFQFKISSRGTTLAMALQGILQLTLFTAPFQFHSSFSFPLFAVADQKQSVSFILPSMEVGGARSSCFCNLGRSFITV